MSSTDRARLRRATDRIIGFRLKARRKELGLSQTALADEIGVCYQQVQKYENGTDRIAASTLPVLCLILRIPVVYFFKDIAGQLSAELAQDAS